MKKAKYTIEYFEYATGRGAFRTIQYRWRIRHRNGRIIAQASEGYHNKAICARSLFRMLDAIEAEDYEVKP